jgi:WD40 repeat protein
VEPAYSRPKAVGTPHRTYPRHHEPIVSIAYSPDGKRIAYETTSGGVHIWPISTGQPASHYQGSTGNWGKLHWSPNGTYLAALFGPGKHPTQAPLPDPAEPWKVAIPKLPAPALEVWYAATGNRVPLPPDLRDSTITTFAWSPTSPTLAIASGENVHIWPETTESLVTYDTQADDVLALACSPDGSKIASGDKGGKVLVWEPIARTTYFQYLGHRSSVQRIAWSPDDKRIASEETNGTIHFWDASKGVKQDEVRPHFFLASGRKSNAGLVEMAWSADGDWIALWEVHWGLQVLDAASRAPVAYHQGALSDHAVAWSPQESRLAVGISKTDQANAQVQIWEAGDWPIRHRFLSPPAETAVATLAWSPDGHQIASTVRGAQVQVWQADGYFPNPPEAGPKYIPPPPLTLTLRWKRLKHKEAALFISIGILLLLFGLIAALSPRGADDVIGWVAAGVGVIFLNIGLYRMWRNR